MQAIVNELKGEKIDIVNWSSDPVEFVANALSPSKVLDVIVNEEERFRLLSTVQLGSVPF